MLARLMPHLEPDAEVLARVQPAAEVLTDVDEPVKGELRVERLWLVKLWLCVELAVPAQPAACMCMHMHACRHRAHCTPIDLPYTRAYLSLWKLEAFAFVHGGLCLCLNSACNLAAAVQHGRRSAIAL